MAQKQFLAAVRASQAVYEAREHERWAMRDGVSDLRLWELGRALADALEAKALAHSALTDDEHRRMGMVSVQVLRGS